MFGIILVVPNNRVGEFTNLKKVTLDNFSLGAYKSYPSIKFPFSV